VRLEELSSLQQLVLPDRWQAEAIQALRSGKDVIVDAPTGAGKTYVFERWAEQTNFSRRSLFTVPTRALANECRIRPVLDGHISKILFPVCKSEVELRQHSGHLQTRFAKGLSRLPRDQGSKRFRGEGQSLAATEQSFAALLK
jgi:hypothetical protein